MADIIRVKNRFYILATSSMADTRTQVLKQGETFAVFDRYGDIEPIGSAAQGIYQEDTRLLSRWTLKLGKDRPLLLSSAVREDNLLLAAALTNLDVVVDGRVLIQRGTVYISRTKFLWQGVTYERLQIWNYGLSPQQIQLSLRFEADFADIFEVRGLQRDRKGRRLPDVIDKRGILMSYEGLDGAVRRTRIECTPEPKAISSSELKMEASLAAHSERTFFITTACESGRCLPCPKTYNQALSEAVSALKRSRGRSAEISSSNDGFNDWVNRSLADLEMMVTETAEGPYPYAGVPWFSTVFGRDGIITAFETLWANAELARGVLAHLASTQATEVIPEADAEPGKILHEARHGEMAAHKEVPFGRYYGSIDSTPLFVLLAGSYYDRTGDEPFVRSIWPNIERALEWMDRYGDADGDGFVEYNRRSEKGLLHQGWKDSSDAVFHADGGLAEGPIALCEVQGYVYAAKRQAARIAKVLGDSARSRSLNQEAEALQERFERAFWCQELSTYALALDGNKRACQVRTSNAGHALFTGIAGPEHAKLLAATLMEEDLFSGWGIRTVASGESRYNPMSYHNGSVWPHDNALIAAGLARYGFRDSLAKVFGGLFDASEFVELHRLPELFCGFSRSSGEAPTLYPVACAPQSWAAAAVFLLLGIALGISVKDSQQQVHLSRPFLLPPLEEVRITNLRVGGQSLDLRVRRHGETVSVEVLRGQADVKVVEA